MVAVTGDLDASTMTRRHHGVPRQAVTSVKRAATSAPVAQPACGSWRGRRRLARRRVGYCAMTFTVWPIMFSIPRSVS
jgi:hypothetical protein